jgi:hypothetical protein
MTFRRNRSQARSSVPFQPIHERTFGKVYPFAGEFRTEEIAKWSDQRQDHTRIFSAELILPWLSRTVGERHRMHYHSCKEPRHEPLAASDHPLVSPLRGGRA